MNNTQGRDENIVKMVAASGVYVLALSNNHLLRVKAKAGKQEQSDSDLGRRPEDEIQQLFMDPTAEHILIWYEPRHRICASLSRALPCLFFPFCYLFFLVYLVFFHSLVRLAAARLGMPQQQTCKPQPLTTIIHQTTNEQPNNQTTKQTACTARESAATRPCT